MAEYFKEPQNPLKKIDEATGDITYVYPMTTAKQVIMDDDGTRLNTILNEHILYLGDAEDDMNVAPVIADNGIYTYVHSTGVLTGEGENGKFKATVTETVSTITVNGTVCVVNCGGESEVELVADAWYTFILDGNTVNFKNGGGLSNSKLAEATATEADVLNGLTFYSGDKELKTGTLTTKIFTQGYHVYDAIITTGTVTLSKGKYLVRYFQGGRIYEGNSRGTPLLYLNGVQTSFSPTTNLNWAFATNNNTFTNLDQEFTITVEEGTKLYMKTVNAAWETTFLLSIYRIG